MTTDDEREALDQIMREADGCWPDAREAILATFRRRGPITDEMVEAAAKSLSSLPDDEWAAFGHQEHMKYYWVSARLALEAAERARSAVPSTTEQEKP